MNRIQQQATRNLDRSFEEWLRAFGWEADRHNRWTHKRHPQPVKVLDAWAITRAQPLLFGASERFSP